MMARAIALALLACSIWLSPVFAAETGAPTTPAPAGIAVDGDGNVYVTDYALDRVVKFAPDGTVLGQWGNSGNGPGQFSSPFGVAVDGGNVVVVDQLNNRVQRFASDGTLLSAFGSAGAGPGDFRTPFGVALAGGHVYVADFGNDRVQILNLLDGSVQSTIGSRGSGDGQFQRPAGVAVGGEGTLYVTDHFNDRVQRFGGDGHFQAQLGTGSLVASASQLTASATGTPTALAQASLVATTTATSTPTATSTAPVVASGTPVATASGTLSPTPSVQPVVASTGLPDTQLQRPEGIALDHDGNIWVADYGHDRLVKLSPDGHVLQVLGGHGASSGEFVGPKGVAVDPQSGRLYVADTGNARVQRLTADGTPDASWPMPPANS
jgi:sugar lactone lactonase YvrE